MIGPTFDENGFLETVVVDAKKLSELTDELVSLRKRVAELEIALNHIANEFMTTEEILNDCENMGLTYEEYLEMSYENIQGAAQAAIDGGALDKEG